jgi:2-iminoacetate synthase
MEFAKSGTIHNFCLPNALMTFKEYLIDYADEELRVLGEETIQKNLLDIPDEAIRNFTIESLKKIENGERDIRL